MRKSTFVMLFVTMVPSIFTTLIVAFPFEQQGMLRRCFDSFGSLCGACGFGGCNDVSGSQPGTSPYNTQPENAYQAQAESIVISNINRVEIHTVEAAPVTAYETSVLAVTQTLEVIESVPTTIFDIATESVPEMFVNTVTEVSILTQVVPTYVAAPVLPAVSIVEIPAPAPACFECQDVQPVAVAPVDTTPVDVTADNVNSVAVAPATPINENPIDANSIDTTPIDTTPIDTTPIDATPIDATPIDATAIDATPIVAAPIDAASSDATPIDASLGDTSQAETVPVQDSSDQA